jgi:uncharacterized protein YfaA (DUF2138 family)
VIAGLVFYGTAWTRVPLSTQPVTLDLSSPDAVIRTKGLSRLPADMLRVPLLHDLLTEDFLFYYDNSEGRLGLKGAIRRIAYEHDITLSDKLIRLALDEQADVALWRGDDGSLKYYAISMTRGKLARVIESVAKIAMKDSQLVMVGEQSVEGKTVQLFALEYAWQRKMLLASHGDRVVIISDPGMVMTAEGDVTPKGGALLEDLLSADPAKQQRLTREFSLDNSEHDHTIAVKVGFLSFSYQHFFPTLKAMRFDFGGKDSAGKWATGLYLDGSPAQPVAPLDARALWQFLPGKAGVCSALPVDWAAVARAMHSKTAEKAGAHELAAQFKGSAAVCWYANSRLYAPLFVAQLKQPQEADAALAAAFVYAIKSGGEDSEGGKDGKAPLPQASRNAAGDTVWQNSEDTGGLRPTLARSGGRVYFSPDAALVEQALAVSHKRQPALTDSWKDPQAPDNTVAVLGPGIISQLAEREIAVSLPEQQDAELRSAASRYLLPRLAAIKKYPPMRLVLRAAPKGPGWVALDWQPY